MAMTPYSGDTSVIGKLGTTPQERGLTTQQFKDKFDEGLKEFVAWFNSTHKTEFDAHLADNAAHGGIYRKNILHNWDFRNPVNQRGQTEYTGEYTIDRWHSWGSGIVRIKNRSIELETTNEHDIFWQSIENPQLYDGKTVTVSIEIDGQIYSGTGVINLSQGTNPTFARAYFSGGYAEVEYVTEIQLLRFRFVIFPGSTVSNITRAKLEFGSVSTLANDPPADYREQLVLCKSFLRNIILSPDEVDAELMGEGDIWIKYEE
jgi:hypothetical protein